MRPEQRDAALLWDMLEHGRETLSFVEGRAYEDYLADAMVRRAVERTVQIIGEAAARLSRSFCDAHPEIPWRAIKAQRHILVHEYDEIDHEKIWRVATVHIPELVSFLEPLVPHPPPDPEPDEEEPP